MGGTVVGSTKVPQGKTDFSSAMLQAQGSRAQVVGLALAGNDMVNAIKGAQEFGLPQAGQKIAGMVLFLTDVKSAGLDATEGTLVTTAYYWDQNEATHTFAKRFEAQMGRPPTMIQAGDYPAVKAAGTVDGPAVPARIRPIPVEDFMTHGAPIRPDGRVVRDMCLAQRIPR